MLAAGVVKVCEIAPPSDQLLNTNSLCSESYWFWVVLTGKAQLSQDVIVCGVVIVVPAAWIWKPLGLLCTFRSRSSG